jgi:hypothetical protein
MALLDRLQRADGDSDHAYLRARGTKSPEQIRNKFIMSGIVYAIPVGLTTAEVNAILPTSVGIRALPVTCGISQDHRFAYIPHDQLFSLVARAAQSGVAI